MSANDQWMPTIVVKPDGHQLFLGWLDRRNDPNNALIGVYGCEETTAVEVAQFAAVLPPAKAVTGAAPRTQVSA